MVGESGEEKGGGWEREGKREREREVRVTSQERVNIKIIRGVKHKTITNPNAQNSIITHQNPTLILRIWHYP